MRVRPSSSPPRKVFKPAGVGTAAGKFSLQPISSPRVTPKTSSDDCGFFEVSCHTKKVVEGTKTFFAKLGFAAVIGTIAFAVIKSRF